MYFFNIFNLTVLIWAYQVNEDSYEFSRVSRKLSADIAFLDLIYKYKTKITIISAKKHHSSSMDTTSNQLTAHSSSSSSSPPTWDVFLSFYGRDTRKNFTSHLYSALDQAGILTFRDDRALEKGEEISSGLRDAIKNSNKFVVVISENYARSSWCLDELAEILGCKRTKNQVIPVFYYVDPSDLRYQKRSFGEALDCHKKRYSVDMVGKWQSALAEIAELSGYHLKKDADKNESDIIEEILEDVAPQASKKRLHLEEYLFGIDSAVEEIFQKVRMESNDVRAIGICGMGGIGKTTTAKAFYNAYSNKFEISCFMENVKQYSQGGNPVLPLLKQLLIELLRRKDYMLQSFEAGIRQLKQILHFKKALIILDNLDQSSHSEFLARFCNLFSAGSRIIITTRDVNLLNQLRVDMSEVDIFMVKELGQIDSLKLFSYHAFRKTMPPENFREISVKFVNDVGGLPLALKVLGSSLRGRTHKPFWNAQLQKVKANPEIHNILKLSYDELGDETEKEIFLDIAFFFVGKDKDEGVHIFESCEFYPEAGIPILVERCLLTIDEDNKFQMHNLIQDMGREVIRKESKHGKCKHLYMCRENAFGPLQNLEGTNTVEGLILDTTTWTNRHLSAKLFERFPNLRLLEIIGAHDITGNFQYSFHQLRCIHWSYCPWTLLPSSFCPQNLVSLNVPFSELKALWTDVLPPVTLKIINVSYSKNFKMTSDFYNFKFLEKLSFRGCESLREVHPSIGQLRLLGHLDLGECHQLKELPHSVGLLTKLGHFDLRNCRSLERLPTSIKQLTNLGLLNMAGCHNLKGLPEQLGDMHGLKMFDASGTAIGQLPDSFGRLVNLVQLNLRNCENLTSLPNSIWKLKFLKMLNLLCCIKLERLPQQLGNMECLEELIVCRTSIEELPDSIGLLSRLQLLDFSFCEKLKINYLPNNIWKLPSLATLNTYQPDMFVTNLPDPEKNMKLKRLVISCNIRLCLPMILSFSCLQELHLIDEGQSFSSLKELSHPDVGHSFASTKAFNLSKLSNLRELRLQNYRSLGSFFPELPFSLTNLYISENETLEQLPYSSLNQLKVFEIWRCTNLQSLPPLPPHLQILKVHECTSLHDLPDLSNLKELENLSVIGCPNMESISLKQNFHQLRTAISSFEADVPNREIAEWFSYKSSGCTVSFDIPSLLGDDFLGLALWVVFKYAYISKICRNNVFFIIRAVIDNKTSGTANKYDMNSCFHTVGEVQSRIECISGDKILVNSGDTIVITFETLLYCSNYEWGEVPCGEVHVEMCGAHVIQKSLSPVTGLKRYRSEDDPADNAVKGLIQDQVSFIPDLNEPAPMEIEDGLYHPLDPSEGRWLDLTPQH